VRVFTSFETAGLHDPKRVTITRCRAHAKCFECTAPLRYAEFAVLADGSLACLCEDRKRSCAFQCEKCKRVFPRDREGKWRDPNDKAARRCERCCAQCIRCNCRDEPFTYLRREKAFVCGTCLWTCRLCQGSFVRGYANCECGANDDEDDTLSYEDSDSDDAGDEQLVWAFLFSFRPQALRHNTN